MPQHVLFDLHFPVTVLDVVLMGRLGNGTRLGPYRKKDKAICIEALRKLEMHDSWKLPFGALSGGQRQRVLIARALSTQPELLLLDEPASGLDPRARIELMEILKELRRLGKTIFISSHILSELALLCDSVTILDRGKTKYSGTMHGLVQRDGPTAEYVLLLAEEKPELEETLRKTPGVAAVTKTPGEPRYQLSFSRDQTDANALLRVVMDGGGRIAGFQEDVRHLNEAFMDLTEPGVPAGQGKS